MQKTEKVSFKAGKLNEMTNHIQIVPHFTQTRLEEGILADVTISSKERVINHKGLNLI